MFRRFSYFIGLGLVAACGGSAFGGGDDAGAAGSSGSAAKGGSAASGGSTSSAGTVGAAGGGGVIDCATARCASPACSQGELVTRPGQCCATCSCDLVDCSAPACAPGVDPIVEPGNCCPTCPTSVASCKDVECQPPTKCEPGYAYERPPGACCAGCVPDPGPVGCREILCPPPNCPHGYVSGERAGGCCYDCVPDPLYCFADQDCVIADRPRPCCGCAEPISVRMYEQDACWSSVAEPRPTPKECIPEVMCGAICGACPPPGSAKCVDHRCTEVR